MSAESNRLISADLLLDTLLSCVSMPEKNDVELASRVKAAYRAQDDFALASVWQAEELPEGQDFFPEVFDAMMRPWVGGVGRLDAKPEDIEELRTFLSNAGVDASASRRVMQALDAGEAAARRFELLSLAELLILDTVLEPGQMTARRTVVEVGGGFGRLGHVFLSAPGWTRYVDIDLVPESLSLSGQFLRHNHPEAKVVVGLTPDDVAGFFADAVSDKAALILPAWMLDTLPPDVTADLCINTASFQEMPPEHVDRYLRLMDDIAVPGTTVMLCNSRDYPQPRAFRYSDRWQLLYKDVVPRSFTPDYPLEIFRVIEGKAEAHPGLEEAYRDKVLERYRQQISSLRSNVQGTAEYRDRLIEDQRALQNQVKRLNRRLHGMKGMKEAQAELDAEVARMRDEMKALQRQNTELKDAISRLRSHPMRTLLRWMLRS